MATMTGSQTFSSLDVPDDEMEISSDAGRNVDLDIDLMDPEDEIDYMIEDEEDTNIYQNVQTASKDDEMLDDLDDTMVLEDFMHDEEPVAPETLQDKHDMAVSDHPEDDTTQHLGGDTGLDTDDYQSELLEDGLPQPTEQLPQELEIIPVASLDVTELQQDHTYDTTDNVPQTTEPVDHTSIVHDSMSHISSSHPNDDVYTLPQEDGWEQEGYNQEEADVDHTSQLYDDSITSDHGAHEALLNAELAGSTNLAQEAEPGPTESGGSIQEEASEVPLTYPAISPEPGQSHHEEDVHSLQEQDPTDETNQTEGASASESQDQEVETTWPTSPLHPVTVEYEGNFMSLFPPTEEDLNTTYLLQHDSVVYNSLVDFFRECRTVLGESISEAYELTITCPELELEISEDSTYCTSSTLAQIIEVYVVLMQHDGVESPGPLSIRLATKSRFSFRLEYLSQAASEAKGLSNLESSDPDESQHPPHEVENIDRATDAIESAENLPSQESVESFGGPLFTNEPAELATYEDRSFESTKATHEQGYEDAYELEEYQDEQENEPSHVADALHMPEDGDEAHDAEAPDAGTGLAKVEPTLESTQLDSSGSAEDAGDVESPRSSTVQGENEAQQSSGRDDFASELLTSVLEVASEAGSQGDETNSVLVQDNMTSTTSLQAHTQHDETAFEIPEDNHTENHDESFTYDPDAVNDEWNPDLYEEGGDDFEDHHTYNESTYLEDNEHVAEGAWEGYDSQNTTGLASFSRMRSGSPTKASLQIPEPIPEEDEEDSITYEDDEPEEDANAPAPMVEVTPTRPTESPSGKRAREADEGGDEDGSDQDTKRLKSH